jgi:hypothetical protein
MDEGNPGSGRGEMAGPWVDVTRINRAAWAVRPGISRRVAGSQPVAKPAIHPRRGKGNRSLGKGKDRMGP